MSSPKTAPKPGTPSAHQIEAMDSLFIAGKYRPKSFGEKKYEEKEKTVKEKGEKRNSLRKHRQKNISRSCEARSKLVAKEYDKICLGGGGGIVVGIAGELVWFLEQGPIVISVSFDHYNIPSFF
jgi:hypothetical protein